MLSAKNWFKRGLVLLAITGIACFLNGCARWPDEPNGGGGTGQKQLIIKLEINEEGTIDPYNGNYYIVFDTNQDASFAPDAELKNWKKGYYYVQLGDIDFIFGEVLEVDAIDGSLKSSWSYYSGTVYDDYFTVTIDLEDLGNPEEFLMNVITTDSDNETYDSLDMSVNSVIPTNIVTFTTIIDDYLEDSVGGNDYDIVQVTAAILTP